MPLCSICGHSVAPRTDNPAFPFCSGRCKQVDLGQWLNEAYRISVPSDDPDSSDAPTSEETDA